MTSFLHQNGTQKGPKRTNKGPRNPRGAPGCPGEPPWQLFEGPGLPRGPLFNRKRNQNLLKTVSNPTKKRPRSCYGSCSCSCSCACSCSCFCSCSCSCRFSLPWGTLGPPEPKGSNLDQLGCHFGAILVPFGLHLGSLWAQQ